VIGGANSAGQGAMFLSRFASQVTMLVRSDSLRKNMSRYLIDQIEQRGNIEVLVNTRLVSVTGGTHLETLKIEDTVNGATRTVPADAIFVFIGAAPHTNIVAGVVERDEAGFILTGRDLFRAGRRPKNWRLQRDPFLMETSVPGIFAAGDVRHGAIRRVASAVGQGAVAVSLVHEYLETV